MECHCKEGYSRYFDHTGNSRCVPTDECPQGQCGDNEHWNECGSSCNEDFCCPTMTGGGPVGPPVTTPWTTTWAWATTAAVTWAPMPATAAATWAPIPATAAATTAAATPAPTAAAAPAPFPRASVRSL